MFSLDALIMLMTSGIPNGFSDWGGLSWDFALIVDPGTDFDSRPSDWSALSAYECNFKGYARAAAPPLPGSGWGAIAADGLVIKTDAVAAEFAYDSGAAGDDTRTNATHVVYIAHGTTTDKIIHVWPITGGAVNFNADGIARTFNLRLLGENIADV